MSELSVVQPEYSHIPKQLGIKLLREQDSVVWRETTDEEAEVFKERGYVFTKEELEKEYAPYLSETEMITLLEHDSVIGGVRLINYDSSIGLKTINDIAGGRLHLDEEGEQYVSAISMEDMFEVGTIALAPAYRSSASKGPFAAAQLYGGIIACGKEKAKRYVIASIDEDYLEGLQRRFGPSIHVLGPKVDYMGSPTAPVIVDLEELTEYTRSVDTEFALMLEAAGEKLEYES